MRLGREKGSGCKKFPVDRRADSGAGSCNRMGEEEKSDRTEGNC